MIDTSHTAICATLRTMRLHGLYPEASLLEEVASERDGARSAIEQLQEVLRGERAEQHSLWKRMEGAWWRGFFPGLLVGALGALVLLPTAIAFGFRAWG